MKENNSFENFVKQIHNNIEFDDETEKVDVYLNKKAFKKAFLISAILTIPFVLSIMGLKESIGTYFVITLSVLYFFLTYILYIILYKTIELLKIVKRIFEKINELK